MNKMAQSASIIRALQSDELTAISGGEKTVCKTDTSCFTVGNQTMCIAHTVCTSKK